MKDRVLLVIVLVFTANFLSAQSPAWAEDVAPILYENCTGCHYSGGIGQFSLIGYPAAFTNRFAIDAAVADRRMPPWPPDPDYRHYAHERVLSASEVQTLRDWITAGAPPGDTSQAPLPPSPEPALPAPDLLIGMDPYVSQAASNDEYHCFSLPTGLTQDKFISALEVVPGNLEIVHHVMIFQDTTGLADSLQNQNPDPGFSCFGQSFGAELLFFWTPGSGPVFFPSGTGMKLHKNADLILQVHYPLGSAGKADSTEVRFRFSDEPNPRQVHVTPFLNAGFSLQNGPLFIPADSIRTFHSRFFIANDLSLLAVLPHAHLLAQSTEVLATNSQDTVPLIRIPKWDFEWQGAYIFQYLQKIEAGSFLRTNFTYDNTAANPNNPNSPPQDVYEGEAATDEMLYVYFWYLEYQPGDEFILMDSTLLTGQAEPVKPESMRLTLAPNPFFRNAPTGPLSVTWSQSHHSWVKMELWDIQGKKRITFPPIQAGAGSHQRELPLGKLSRGIYYLRLRTANHTLTRKLVVF